MKKILLLPAVLFFCWGNSLNLKAQTDAEILNWYNSKAPGMSVEKAYALVKAKTGKPVVVGVIDSGVDIEHEDLKGQIWTNPKEIAGNGKDDDNNGYVDDIHGWNFLGGKNGKNVDHENLEFVRIYKKLKGKYEGKTAETVAASDKDEFKLFSECKAKLEKERAENEMNLMNYKMLKEQIIPMVPQIVAKELGKTDYTLKDLKKWKPKNSEMEQFKQLAMAMLSGELADAEIKEALDHFDNSLKYNLNVDFNGREVVGDDPDNFSQKSYGNNDVEGPDALHGTHVSGIICALRGNNLGGDGVATNVQIMSLRAVPDGDEYDKDVAMAIRYAADNGAQVVNMSFGKSFSPHQKEVYEAMKYAESKGVLLIHAAGNDAEDNDVVGNFPSAKFSFQKEDFTHLLSIGASTRYPKGKLVASFSNYGAKTVDIFAPGLEIYNTVPDNKYRKLQGTSMAAPMVAGAAAFLKSYFPELTMLEIKEIILQTGTDYGKSKQAMPGTGKETTFSVLSKTGKVVNLENAVKAAEAKMALKKN